MHFILNCIKASFIQFSRVPLNGASLTAEHFAFSVNYLPIVGLAIGLVCSGAGLYLLDVIPPAPVAISMIILGIMLTGAIHEDGLADCCDGLFGGANKDTRLQIMKDSTLGTYGVLGLLSVLGLKASLLSSMPKESLLIAFISAQALSRITPLLIIAFSHYTTAATSPKMTANIQLNKKHAIPVVCVILLFNFFLIPVTFILLSITCIIAVSVISKTIFDNKINGFNGDCLGATQQVTECALLMLSVVFI